jgi:hypothetical protein
LDIKAANLYRLDKDYTFSSRGRGIYAAVYKKRQHGYEIQLRGIELTTVQRYWDTSVKKVLSYKKILLFMWPIHVWHSWTPDGVRCMHIMSQQK